MTGTSNSKRIPTNNPKDRNLSIGKKIKISNETNKNLLTLAKTTKVTKHNSIF